MNMPDINNLNRAEPERETTPQQKEANAQIDRAINALKAEHALRRATGELAEIARLRALVKELADAFAPFLDFYGDPYESEAEALMHKCAIAALAKARKVTP